LVNALLSFAIFDKGALEGTVVGGRGVGGATKDGAAVKVFAVAETGSKVTGACLIMEEV
jgi:hypothetical protein